MGLTGDLVEAYELLDRHYGPRVPSLEAPRTTSLAEALETPPGDTFVKLTLTKKPQLEAPSSRPALPTRRSHPALPDLRGRS